MESRLNRMLRVLCGNFERVSRPGKESANVDDLLCFIRESGLGVNGATGTLTRETILRIYCLATDWLLYVLLLPMIDNNDWLTRTDVMNRNIEAGLAQVGVSGSAIITTNMIRDWNHDIFISIGAFPAGLQGQAIQMYDNRVAPAAITLYCTTSPSTYVLAGPKPAGTELVSTEHVSGYVRIVVPAAQAVPAVDNAGQRGIVPIEGRLNISINDNFYSPGVWQPFTNGLSVKTLADTPEPLFISILLSSAPSNFSPNTRAHFISLPSSGSPMPASIAPGNPAPTTPFGILSTIALRAFGVPAYSFISSINKQHEIEVYSRIVNLVSRMA